MQLFQYRKCLSDFFLLQEEIAKVKTETVLQKNLSLIRRSIPASEITGSSVSF